MKAMRWSVPDAVVFRLSDAIAPENLVGAKAAEARTTRTGLDTVLAMAASGHGRVQPLFRQSRHREGPLIELAAARAADDLSLVHVAEFESEKRAGEALELLRQDPRVAYAHHPAIHRPLSNDPGFTKQWYLREAGFDRLWTHFTASDPKSPVRVAVIDTGADPNHPDLPPFERYETFGLSSADEEDHGTSVCALLAARRGNSVGVAGAIDCLLHVYKVYPSPSLWKETHLALERVLSSDARVLNFSMGSREKDPTVASLVQRCLDAGVTIVAAAGNDKTQGNPTMYPAALPGVVAVGAVQKDRKRWYRSQTGPHLFLSAYGVGLHTCRAGKKYGAVDGTSFAAPLVTAAVAYLLRNDPTLTPAEIRTRLRDACEPVNGSPNEEYGYGVLNAVRLFPSIA